jgi:hypothetical protein
VDHLRRPLQDEYLTWSSTLQPQRCKSRESCALFTKWRNIRKIYLTILVISNPSASRRCAPIYFLPYRRRLTSAGANRQRVLSALAPAGLAEAHLRTQTRMSKPKDVEFDFAKRIHISHVKSTVCAFQSRRNQGGSGDIRGKRHSGTRHGRPLSLSVHGGFAKSNRSRPR